MSKGDFYPAEGEELNTAPPDFCALGQHSDEIHVSDDGTQVRRCNDCGREDEVQPDECVKGADWFPEHDYHFGVCARCGAESEE